MRRVAVFRVIEQRGAIVRFGEIGEAVSADLVVSGVPGRVAVGWAAGHPVQRLVGRLMTVHSEGEASLQVRLALVPVNAGGDVQPSRARQQAVRLLDVRVPPGATNPYGAA